MDKHLNIAIVSTNLNKYSETFIHNHIKLLPGNIHLLFDGYLPKKYSADRGQTSESLANYLKNKWFTIKQKDTENNYENLPLAVENYLRKNNINVILCEYGPSGVEMMEMANKLNIPLVTHFHGYDAYRNDILNSYGKRYPELFSKASALIAVSNHMAAQLKQLGCNAEKLQMLPYGIDTGFFNSEKETEKIYDFVYCGRFVTKKSPTTVIKTFAKLKSKYPAIKMVMLGDGELMQDCLNIANDLNVGDAINFKGAVEPKEVVRVLSQSKIFVQHSITSSENDHEGTPLSLMECAALGLPAVATKHGGIPDLVIHGETGFLVNENDSENMAIYMERLFLDSNLAEQMGATAKKRIQTYYTISEYIRNLYGILHKATIR